MPPDTPIVAIVDDDKIFQFTASKTIRDTEITKQVLQFGNGEEALRYIKANLTDASKLPDYLFLDINMPFVDGWMFLEDYAGLNLQIPKSMTIYMVSSSIDPRDIARARNNHYVSDYVIKPVSRERFVELLKPAA